MTRIISFPAAVRFWASVACALTLLGCTQSGQQDSTSTVQAVAGEASDSPLIPRRLFFENRQRSLARISPDGQKVAWLAQDNNAVSLWVASSDAPEQARQVASGPGPGVFFYEWAADNTHMIFGLYDQASMSKRVLSVDIATGETKNLSPEGAPVSAWVIALSFDYPTHVLVGVNNSDMSAADVYKVNIATGERKRIMRNEAGFAKFHADSNLAVRIAERVNPNGGVTAFVRDSAGGSWRLLTEWAPEDAVLSRIIGFDGSGRHVYALDSTGRDTAALVRFDSMTGARLVIGARQRADVSIALVHPATGAVDAFASERLSRTWTPLTANGADALNRLQAAFPDSVVYVTGRSLDDQTWSVFVSRANEPGAYYLLDRARGGVSLLFQTQPALSARLDTQRTPVVIKADDGLDMVGQLTLPRSVDSDGDGRPDAPLATIIIPPSGPWSHVETDYNRDHAFLASRGYAILAVNARGARGAGKRHVNAAAGQWSNAFIDDIAVAADWAVEKGVADPQRIGVIGDAFGGYAALALVARQSDMFKCGVSLAPVADFIALAEDPRPRMPSHYAILRRLIGDLSDPRQRAMLMGSTLTRDAIRLSNPTLVITTPGMNATQARAAEEALTNARAQGAPVSLAVLDETAGGLMLPQNSIAGAALVENFFAQCLGGAAEPRGVDFETAPIEIVFGASRIFADAPPDPPLPPSMPAAPNGRLVSDTAP